MMEWIPVEKGMPENMRQVLMTVDRCKGGFRVRYVTLGVFNIADDGRWYDDTRNDFADGEVVAWMPVPRPYGKGARSERRKIDEDRR